MKESNGTTNLIWQNMYLYIPTTEEISLITILN